MSAAADPFAAYQKPLTKDDDPFAAYQKPATPEPSVMSNIIRGIGDVYKPIGHMIASPVKAYQEAQAANAAKDAADEAKFTQVLQGKKIPPEPDTTPVIRKVGQLIGSAPLAILPGLIGRTGGEPVETAPETVSSPSATISSGGTNPGTVVPPAPPPAVPGRMARIGSTLASSGTLPTPGEAITGVISPKAGAVGYLRRQAGRVADAAKTPPSVPEAGPPKVNAPTWSSSTSSGVAPQLPNVASPSSSPNPAQAPVSPPPVGSPTPAGSINVAPPEGVPPEYLQSAEAGIKAQAANRYARNQLIIQEARKQGLDLSKMGPGQRDAFARTIGSRRPLSPQSDRLLLQEFSKAKPIAKTAGGEPGFAKGGVVSPGGSVEDRVRGSANIPLSQEGQQEAIQLGQNLARKGFGRRGDTITPGKLDRAQQTAQAIAQFAPHAKMMKPDPTLDTWRLGALEGQLTDQVKPQIEDLINNPDKVPPPGDVSSAPPESWNQFKQRYLPPWKQRIQKYLAQPNNKHVYTTHGRGQRLVHGWIKGGMPDSLEVDPKYVLAENDRPADVHRIALGSGGKLQVKEIDPSKPGRLKSGILNIRHASTDWNKPEQGEGPGQTPEASWKKGGVAEWHKGGMAIPSVQPLS